MTATILHIPTTGPSATQVLDRVAPGVVRATLIAATREQHEALHRAPPFRRLAQPPLDRAAYAGLLGAIADFHRRTAAAVHAGAVAIGLPSLARAAAERAARLRADLADLGAVPGPAPAPSLAPASDDRAVGCLYVVEGSTLGGRLIHRRLAGLLPGEEGRRYFAGGADDVERWPVFCAALEAFGAGGSRLPEIVLGARQAFATFRDCLEGDR